MCMKDVKNFRIVQIQPPSVTWHLLIRKVLLINKVFNNFLFKIYIFFPNYNDTEIKQYSVVNYNFRDLI